MSTFHPIGPLASWLSVGLTVLTQSQQHCAEGRGKFEFHHVRHNGPCLRKTDGAKCEANGICGKHEEQRSPFSPEHDPVCCMWNHTSHWSISSRIDTQVNVPAGGSLLMTHWLLLWHGRDVDNLWPYRSYRWEAIYMFVSVCAHVCAWICQGQGMCVLWEIRLCGRKMKGNEFDI